MATTYNKVDIRGKAYERIYSEILFNNDTVSQNLVTFADNIKASTIITENTNSIVLQAYTTGAPSATGSIALFDTEITPVKVMAYDEFEYESLRLSRFNSTMTAGAFNYISTEFDRTVIQSLAPKISATYENNFWNGIKSTTKTAIANLGTASYTAAELSYSSNSTAGLVDGVVARMLYNSDKSAVGGCVKVAGTTITSSNIAAEYAKVYTAIPAVVLNTNETPYIYAPRSHKQLINIYNISATYRDLFSVDMGANKYFYNGVEIKFVPLPENTIVAGLPSNFMWCTDLSSDFNKMEVDKIANNRDDYFYKNVATMYCHIVRQSQNVLYKG